MAGSTFLTVLHFFIDTDDPPVPGCITVLQVCSMFIVSHALFPPGY